MNTCKLGIPVSKDEMVSGIAAILESFQSSKAVGLILHAMKGD